MQAFFIDEPGHTSLRDTDAPQPAQDEVLLRVRVVGFCGTDLATYRGVNPLVSYPRIPGHEIAATVGQVGDDVPAGLSRGAQVTVVPYTNCGACSPCRLGRTNCCQHNQTAGVQRDGYMTALVVVHWRKIVVCPDLPLRDLALVEPLTIGFHAVDRGEVTESDTVAVFGAGTVGLGAIAGAAARGARVISVDIDDAKLALAEAAGAAETINSTTSDLHDALQGLTDDLGPQVVIEAVGAPTTYRAAVDSVDFAGRVVYIGYAKQPVEYEAKQFVMKELDVRGSRNATPEDFSAVMEMLRRRAFPVDEVVTHTVAMAEAGDALRQWDADPDKVGKILVEIDG